MFSFVQNIIGVVPVEYQFIVYVVAGVLTVSVVCLCLSFIFDGITSIFK